MAAGDVILFHRPTFGLMTSLIHLTTRSRWNHVALDIGDGKMVEATSSGVRVNRIASQDEMLVVRGALNPAAALCSGGPDRTLQYFGPRTLETVLAFGAARVGWRYGYLNAFMCGLRHVFPGLTVKAPDTIICSELVAEALERAGHDFGKDSANVSPGDVAEHFSVKR